ncbi:MAG: hypothetical protein L6Q33_07625 [Bacteriovoracaceae bacterium]|nr:hypothetical protein [Bacteriovoracaceae bacterium]
MKTIKALLVIILSAIGLQNVAAKADNDYSKKIKEVTSEGKGVDNHGERICGTRIVK